MAKNIRVTPVDVPASPSGDRRVILQKIRADLIFFIIPLNVLADTLMQFYDETAEIHSGLIRAPILIAILLCYVPRVKINLLSLMIMMFLGYLGILILFSSNFAVSLSTFIKVAVSFSVLPISYSVITNQEAFKKLQYSLIVSVGIALINFFLAQIFRLGEIAYTGHMFYMGGMGVRLTYLFAYALVLAPLCVFCIKKKRYRLSALIMYSLSAAVVLTTFRRGAMAALIIGFAVLLFVGHGKVKRQTVKLLATGLVALMIFFLFYGNTIAALYKRRIADGLSRDLATSYGRVNETRVVWNEFFNKSLKHTMFGTELFNSREYFHAWKRDGRIIHIDYNVVLHGSGAVGLALFLGIYWAIFRSFHRHQKYFPKTPFYDHLKPTFWAVIAVSITLSLTNQLGNITSYTIYCLNIGAMLRMAKNAKVDYSKPMDSRSAAPI